MKDADQEGRDKFDLELEKIQKEKEFKTRSKPDNTKKKQQPKEAGGKGRTVAMPKWQAPPGWTPPGWDEQASYGNAMEFMGSNVNKGGNKPGKPLK